MPNIKKEISVRKRISLYSKKEIPPGTEVIKMYNQIGSMTIDEFVAFLYEHLGDEFLNDNAKAVLLSQKI